MSASKSKGLPHLKKVEPEKHNVLSAHGMGVFYITTVVYGVYVKNDQNLDLSSVPNTWKYPTPLGCFITDVTLHFKLRPISSIIDEGDLEQGFVAKSDLVRMNYVKSSDFEKSPIEVFLEKLRDLKVDPSTCQWWIFEEKSISSESINPSKHLTRVLPVA